MTGPIWRLLYSLASWFWHPPTNTRKPGGPPMATPTEQHFTPPPPPPQRLLVPLPPAGPQPMPHSRGRRVIESIVGAFETGTPTADYGAVAVLKDSAGISYGKHQSTDGGGSLIVIMRRYAAANGLYSKAVGEYVSWIADQGSTTEDPDNLSATCCGLMDALASAGDWDLVMRCIQDEVFAERYWEPAAAQCVEMGLVLPLSWSLVYDTCIQSPLSYVRKHRNNFAELPPALGGDEKAWCRAYIDARYRWLANHENPRVAMTKARMGAFKDLVEASNWQLQTPLRVLGIEVGGSLHV